MWRGIVLIRLESIMLKSFATILFQNSFIALLLFPLLLAIVLKNALENGSQYTWTQETEGKYQRRLYRSFTEASL